MYLNNLYSNQCLLSLSKETIEYVAEQNKDYAQSHGICMRLNDQKDKSDVVQILPTTLVPSRVPEKLFRLAYDVQQDLLLLYHKVAFDYEFIKETLRRAMKTDDFTSRLFDIYTKVYRENVDFLTQPFVMNVIRADYMFHRRTTANANEELVLRQVEVNTIATGGPAASVSVNEMHKHTFAQHIFGSPDQIKFVPENLSLTNVAAGLADAYRAYGNCGNGIILTVVEEVNQNAIDQRMLEYEIAKHLDSQVQIRRLTLTQCFDSLTLATENDGHLKLVTKDGDRREVALIYFRSGYSPEHYPTDKEWSARLMMEKSYAIKCPWIGAQLAGTKKVQQVLAIPSVIAKFVGDAHSERRILDTFADLYGLDVDDPNTADIVAMACRNPENFVLKPQLEGGGNNVYDKELAQTLRTLPADELEAYILMERLRPLVQYNVLVRNNQPLTVIKVSNELGIFGYLLGSKDVVKKQMVCGHMIRTKPSDAKEGGISTGDAAQDTPFLV